VSAAGQNDPDDALSARSQLIEQLFREHNEALIRFLLTRLRSRQEAQEVAQEAYVRLLSLEERGAVSYLRAFLFKTAANLAVDRLRRANVHARATTRELFRELSDGRTPERRLAGAQEIEQLAALVEQLPPKCRQAFILNRFHGLDFGVIAAQMGLSERMTRTYVVRALLFCKVQLQKLASERVCAPQQQVSKDSVPSSQRQGFKNE